VLGAIVYPPTPNPPEEMVPSRGSRKKEERDKTERGLMPFSQTRRGKLLGVLGSRYTELFALLPVELRRAVLEVQNGKKSINRWSTGGGILKPNLEGGAEVGGGGE